MLGRTGQSTRASTLHRPTGSSTQKTFCAPTSSPARTVTSWLDERDQRVRRARCRECGREEPRFGRLTSSSLHSPHSPNSARHIHRMRAFWATLCASSFQGAMAKIGMISAEAPESVQPLLAPDLKQRPAEKCFEERCPACFSRVAFRRACGRDM